MNCDDANQKEKVGDDANQFLVGCSVPSHRHTRIIMPAGWQCIPRASWEHFLANLIGLRVSSDILIGSFSFYLPLHLFGMSQQFQSIGTAQHTPVIQMVRA